MEIILSAHSKLSDYFAIRWHSLKYVRNSEKTEMVYATDSRHNSPAVRVLAMLSLAIHRTMCEASVLRQRWFFLRGRGAAWPVRWYLRLRTGQARI
jgi:hypothetical protein